MKPKHLAWPALLQYLWHAGQNAAVTWVVGILLLSHLNSSKLVVRWSLAGLALLTVGLLVVAVVRYGRFTYLVDATGVIIRRGVLVRQLTHLPYHKIQTVQRQQWFYLRPFHLERLTIETAGKGEAEDACILSAVPQTVGNQIEGYRQKSPTTDEIGTQPAVTPSSEYQISWADLNTYALSSLGIVPIIAVLGWLYDKATKLIPKQDVHQFENQLLALRGGWLVGLLVLILFLGFLVSYLSVIERYYHFVLRKSGQTLMTTRGYFQQNQVSVPQKRIQAVRIKQNVIRQWLGLSSVQVLTAGQADEHEREGAVTLIPVIRTAGTFGQLAAFIDWLPQQTPTFIPVRRLPRRYFIRNCGLIWLAGFSLVAVAIKLWLPGFLHDYLWSGPVWLVIAGLQGRYAGRNAGVGLINPQLIGLQTGIVFTRQQMLVPRVKIQSLAVTQSVWMRRSGLAHLTVKLRSGTSTTEVTVRYLDVNTVRQVQQWYLKAPTQEVDVKTVEQS
ncbi:PH domain-containing protein [Lactiplantibacillus carotarum]|uniref:PH domain-containing protein n=1 Tax=Lactiplantibacillus carotarum TaxID=2993456 RepID=UPI00298F0E01|nr:PH domain-containing protein [Lactiplantibacillus carotarum]